MLVGLGRAELMLHYHAQYECGEQYFDVYASLFTEEVVGEYVYDIGGSIDQG